jgi:hypothetical protein
MQFGRIARLRKGPLSRHVAEGRNRLSLGRELSWCLALVVTCHIRGCLSPVANGRTSLKIRVLHPGRRSVGLGMADEERCNWAGIWHVREYRGAGRGRR